MKKKHFFLLISLICVIILTACSGDSYVSYTYKVETGDNVKIVLDSSDGYDLSSELPFTISKRNENLSHGMFITVADYEQYIEVVNNDEQATVIEQASDGNKEYLFWSYSDSEYNYAIYIIDSNTAILLGNNISEVSAKECFERLKFSIE